MLFTCDFTHANLTNADFFPDSKKAQAKDQLPSLGNEVN
jgi:hypothetical protein